ncbi:MAG: glycosyltransferase family 4 protein [Gluconacetobacter diazotrophicus]|nr:glycosyltransferase family 4 protein [Gluconacetobacter diazotrophicus]
MSPDSSPLPGGPARLRVLVASHSHPAVQNGGSEVASYALFDALRRRDRAGEDIRAWYLGCAHGDSWRRAGSAITQPFGPDEYLYSVGEAEWFKYANRDAAFARDFRALLRDLRPDVVHLHHYINFGMEALLHVREVLPDALLVLTLHEFLAICHQQGQMVKRPDGRLCARSGPVDCSRCFPELAPSEFFVRYTYIERFMRHVHRFVAPSRFLARRYVEWGIPADAISVIENIPSRAASRGEPPLRPADGALRIGFFGQISVLKGIEVVIEAARLLDRTAGTGPGQPDIVLSVHGDHTNQPPAFRDNFPARMADAPPTLEFRGRYDNAGVGALMESVDAVLVPSIWWENSPVVIQEAFRHGRPVICSDIGGMAEKVTNGVDGLHFPVGDARGLVAALRRLAADPELLRRLSAGAAATAAAGAAADPLAAHLRLYREHGPSRSIAAAGPRFGNPG